jgi:hypothetical protein
MHPSGDLRNLLPAVTGAPPVLFSISVRCPYAATPVYDLFVPLGKLTPPPRIVESVADFHN